MENNNKNENQLQIQLRPEIADGKYTNLAMIGHSASNLNAYLSMGVDWGELSDGEPQYPEEGVFPDVAYQFLQWSPDSRSMLISYSFSDTDGTRHEGYFWYNCETGTVTGTLKLQAS